MDRTGWRGALGMDRTGWRWGGADRTGNLCCGTGRTGLCWSKGRAAFLLGRFSVNPPPGENRFPRGRIREILRAVLEARRTREGTRARVKLRVRLRVRVRVKLRPRLRDALGEGVKLRTGAWRTREFPLGETGGTRRTTWAEAPGLKKAAPERTRIAIVFMSRLQASRWKESQSHSLIISA